MSGWDAGKTRAQRNREAVDAWARGRAASGRGDLPAARFWLERICRIAPDDGRPQFELALTLAALNDPLAAEALQAIAVRYDHGEAWIALAAWHYQGGDPSAAAIALERFLRSHEAPEPDAASYPDFARLADHVVRAGHQPGWCAIAGGRLIVRASGADIAADDTSVRDSVPDPARATRLDVTVDGVPVLGSPLDLRALRRVEGIATGERGGITGWVVYPAAPDCAPGLKLVDRTGISRKIRPHRRLEPSEAAPFLPRHQFRVTAARLRGLAPPFRIIAADDRPLSGTPIDPARLAALKPVARHARPRSLPKRAALCAVMPAYRDAAMTKAAIASFLAASARPAPLIVVDDASPEPALVALLDAERASERIVLVRHRTNRGFPAAANAGIAAARRLLPGCDILLLNADILLPPTAPARLHAALYAAPDIASATPLSNEATILSYPARQGANPPPDLAGTTRLDALARRANGNAAIDIPTAIGFCMAIRHDALDATGRFDARIFAQGYGEENDWCRRAAALGFRHVAAPGVFVAHHGGASFGTSGAALCARNLVLLERMHPGYHALIESHHADDPLRHARFRLDRARFRAARGAHGAVVLVSHDHGGGIARIVTQRMAQLRAAGIRPILAQPDFAAPAAMARGTGPTRLTDGVAADYPNLCFDLPGSFGALVTLLKAESVRHVEFHHMLGHDPSLWTLPARLGVPAEHVVHDYGYFCKRINLIGPARRYCGEPDVAGCDACIAKAGSELSDPVAPADLIARSSAHLRAARRITAPSADAASRMRRHFPGLSITAEPWEDDSALLPPDPPGPDPRLIAVVGGIGPAKGYDVLLDCARDAAARNLPLTFVLIGASEDDAPLIETGRVRITGPYKEGEATALLRRSGATLGFLPSIWPETWCFALTELWRGGLCAIGFDLGAQAARIKATGRGFLLPLGLPVARINHTLLAWRPDLGDLTQRMQSHETRTVAPADI